MLTLEEITSHPLESTRLFHQSIYGQKYYNLCQKAAKMYNNDDPRVKKEFIDYAKNTAQEVLLKFNVENFFRRSDNMPFELLIPFSVKAKDRESFIYRVRLEAFHIITHLISMGVESASVADEIAYEKIKDNFLDDRFMEDWIMPFFDGHVKAREKKAKAIIEARNVAREEVETLIDCFGRLSSLYGDREGFFKTLFSLGLRTKNYWLDKRIYAIITYAKDRYWAIRNRPILTESFKDAFDTYLKIKLKHDTHVGFYRGIRLNSPKDKTLDWAINHIEEYFDGRCKFQLIPQLKLSAKKEQKFREKYSQGIF